MNPKVVFIAKSADHLATLVETHAFDGGMQSSGLADGRVVVVAHPRHAHTRFALADETGVVVLPGPHAPEPIGDLHQHLAHIEAQPEQTPRQVYLLLHERHGPAFHPDV